MQLMTFKYKFMSFLTFLGHAYFLYCVFFSFTLEQSKTLNKMTTHLLYSCKSLINKVSWAHANAI